MVANAGNSIFPGNYFFQRSASGDSFHRLMILIKWLR